MSAIDDKHAALGGPGGFLGHPVDEGAGSAEMDTADGRGRVRDYQGGSIYWSPATGAHEIHGEIRIKFGRLGGTSGFLGFPTTDETGTPDGVGRFNHFEGGSIYWSPTTRAHAVLGAIRQRWAALGWESGPLGLPRTGELVGKSGRGRDGVFEGGEVHWCRATGAHEVRGAIRAKWAEIGWENSALGFPASDEYDIPGGRRSDFQYGSITWTPSAGAVVHRR